MDDNQIADIIGYWLEREEERIARAKFGQDLVLTKYTHAALVNDMYSAWRDYIANNIRGMRYPYPFSPNYTRPFAPTQRTVE
jgi:hypothetical protein